MHTRQVFRYLTVLALVATVIAAPAVTGADGGTHFAYDFSEGYVQQYKVNFKQEMFRGSFSWSAIVDLEVTEKCVGSPTKAHSKWKSYSTRSKLP